jgi:HD-like signal output (HDOD) protein
MMQVLFVDDEPRVLDGLRVALRPQRNQWQMSFAPGGAEAIALLDGQRFDAVVCDLRMPKVDGARVLREVQQRQPWAARIVLSGFADMETTMRAVPFAHQYLGKPCNVAVLVDHLTRAGQLNSLLNSEAVRTVASRVTALPSLPANYRAMQAAIADSDADAASIARVLERDVAMCAKVLQLVNSAYFGLPRHISSIEDAVVLLGFDLVRNLALAAEVFRGGGEGLAMLEQHSLAVAGLARQLASNREEGDDACLAGMLHDLGKMVLEQAWPGQGAEDERMAVASGRPVCELEFARMGTTHAEVGGFLLGLWGLGSNIVEVVTHHHEPGRVGPRCPGALTAVAVADALVHEAESRAVPAALADFLASLQLPVTKLEDWRARARALRMA